MATTSTHPTTIHGSEQQEVRIYSHSTLFYWWPVKSVFFGGIKSTVQIE